MNTTAKALLRPLSRRLRQLKKLPQALELRASFQEKIAQRDPARPAVWLLGAADHGNLGDLAQRLAIESWAQRWLPEAQLIAAPTLAVREALPLLPGDRLLFQSGYTMTDAHPDELLRRRLLAKPLEQPLWLLPQTICYEKDKSRDTMAACLERQQKLLLLARDEVSLREAQRLAPGRAEGCPDIVASWAGTFSLEKRPRQGIGLCLRQDGESALSRRQRRELEACLASLGKVEPFSCSCAPGYEAEKVRRLVAQALGQLSGLELLVTDRLHGALFGALAGTPLILLPTRDHKLSAALPWLEELCQGEVALCGDLEQLPTLVEELRGRAYEPGGEAAAAWEQLGRRWREF